MLERCQHENSWVFNDVTVTNCCASFAPLVNFTVSNVVY